MIKRLLSTRGLGSSHTLFSLFFLNISIHFFIRDVDVHLLHLFFLFCFYITPGFRPQAVSKAFVVLWEIGQRYVNIGGGALFKFTIAFCVCFFSPPKIVREIKKMGTLRQRSVSDLSISTYLATPKIFGFFFYYWGGPNSGPPLE